MSDVIRAKKFVVVDDEGRERATLGMNGDRVGLELFASGGDQPAITLQLLDNGDTRLKLIRRELTAELKLCEHDVSVELSNASTPKATCAMKIDSAGAWLVAEASDEVGMRVLSRNDGTSTSIWLSETFRDGKETGVRQRFLQPNPNNDKTGAWQTDHSGS